MESVGRVLVMPLSSALSQALEDFSAMTPRLMAEWQLKRPDQYKAHKRRSIERALEQIQPSNVPTLSTHTAPCYAPRS